MYYIIKEDIVNYLNYLYNETAIREIHFIYNEDSKYVKKLVDNIYYHDIAQKMSLYISSFDYLSFWRPIGGIMERNIYLM